MSNHTTGRRPLQRRRLRKAILVTHVAVSVGWFGVVVVMVVMAITLRHTEDPVGRLHGYELMSVIDVVVVRPMTLLTLATGIASGLTSKWGVLRYHWVAAKLGLVLLAMVNGTFFLHEWTGQVIADAADRAARQLLIGGNLIAFVLLTTATILSIYKPWGRTPWGRHAISSGSRRLSQAVR